MPHSNNDNYGRYRDRSYGTFHTVVVCYALISLAFSAFAELKPPATINDGIDRSDSNFVTASLLVMSLGNELYSCAGHSCIRFYVSMARRPLSKALMTRVGCGVLLVGHSLGADGKTPQGEGVVK